MFLALCFLYVWLWLNPALMYDGYWVTGEFPVFWLGREFFMGFASRPGGLTEYASAFLSQLYYWPWLGALAITAVGSLLVLGTWVYLSVVSGAVPRLIHTAPVVLLLVLYSRYNNAIAEALALVAAVSCAATYGWLPSRRRPFRLFVFMCLGGIVFYLSAGAVLMYAALCGIYELAAERPVLGSGYVASAVVALYVVSSHVLRVGLAEGYGRVGPAFDSGGGEEGAILLHCLRLFFPFAAMGMLLERRRGGAVRAVSAPQSMGAAAGAARAWVRGPWRALEPLLLGVAALVLILCGDTGLRSALSIEHFGQRGMWKRLLAEARTMSLERYDANVRWYVNRALYHTGRLGSDMFSFAQDRDALTPHADPLAADEVQALTYAKLARMLTEMGRVNEAERMASEALEVLGDRPAVLRMLADVSIVKGEMAAARVFLTALCGDVVRRKVARQWLRLLAEDPTAFREPEVQRIRSCMVQRDGMFSSDSVVQLRELLDRNPQNRMAFEYLMAHYLLKGDLKGVADSMERLTELGYEEVPRHYAEAAVLFRERGGVEHAASRGAAPDVEGQCREFRKALDEYGGDRQAARMGLKGRYGDSYFYYYEFALDRGRE